MLTNQAAVTACIALAASLSNALKDQLLLKQEPLTTSLGRLSSTAWPSNLCRTRHKQKVQERISGLQPEPIQLQAQLRASEGPTGPPQRPRL